MGWGFEGVLLNCGRGEGLTEGEVWAGLAPGRSGVWAGLLGKKRLYTCALKARFPCVNHGGGSPRDSQKRLDSGWSSLRKRD